MPDHERARLWKDGHGIERLPVEVTVSSPDGLKTVDAVIIRAADLLALEDVLAAAADVVAVCSDDGIHWDDADERARLFAEAEAVWERMIGVWRGAEAMFERDGSDRPW